jgi:hypothetical protein
MAGGGPRQAARPDGRNQNSRLHPPGEQETYNRASGTEDRRIVLVQDHSIKMLVSVSIDSSSQVWSRVGRVISIADAVTESKAVSVLAQTKQRKTKARQAKSDSSRLGTCTETLCCRESRGHVR